MRNRIAIFLLLLLACPVLAIAGCKRSLPALDVPKSAAPFDNSNCGTVRGQIVWEGELPNVAPFRVRTHGHFARQHLLGKSFDNPNLPIVDPATGGVRDAVVFLCGIDNCKAAPWEHPPVSVELQNFQFLVRQGYERSRVGFVHKGDKVKFRSLTSTTHVLRARGDAFFSLPFVEPNRDTVRQFDRTGLVELTSGAGYHWMHAHLFVSDHPYIARTDAHGRFQLKDVPAGECSIVCWMPNWRIDQYTRETESGYIKHATYGKPLEQESRITVEAGREASMQFRVYREMFER